MRCSFVDPVREFIEQVLAGEYQHLRTDEGRRSRCGVCRHRIEPDKPVHVFVGGPREPEIDVCDPCDLATGRRG